MGKRPELVGGGLLRSRQREQDDAFQDSDERVLGSGEFVADLRHGGYLEQRPGQKSSLPELEQQIAATYGLPHLHQRGRQNRAAQARSVFCYSAVRLQGYSGAEVGRYLGIGTPAANRMVPKGEAAVVGDGRLCAFLERVLKKIECPPEPSP